MSIDYARTLQARFEIGSVYTWDEINLFADVHGFHLVECEADGELQSPDELTVNIGDDAEELVWQFRFYPTDISDSVPEYELVSREDNLMIDAAEYYRCNLREDA